MVDRRKLKQFSISEIGTILLTLPNNLVMPLNGYTGLQIWEMQQRRIKTKSHYKMTCSCCKKVINRGDDITQIQGCAGALRQRESSKRTGGPRWQHELRRGRYTPTRNKWVHLTCKPAVCYRHGWAPMELISGRTWYSDHIEDRQAAAAMDPDWGENWWDIPNPEWVLGRIHVEACIIKLQRRFKMIKRSRSP